MSTVASHLIALDPITTSLAVATIGGDVRLAERAALALEREGLIAHVEVAQRGPAAMDRLQRRPEVVLIAEDDPSVATAEAHAIRRRLGDVHVIVILSPNARHDLRHLLDAGVEGVAMESDLEATLGLVIRSACAGYVSVPRALRHGVELPAFSHRERQILRLVVAGMSNEEIARALYLAKSTVAGHLTSVFRRLGVRSRSEAVALVLTADESLRRTILGPEPASGIEPGRVQR